MPNEPWNNEADIYKELLITEKSDIHFGVGIPGNSEMGIIPYGNYSLRALDIGCGSGENVFALSSLGYHTVGIDFSERQVALAAELCASIDEDKRPAFFALPAECVGKVEGTFDIIISMGVLHFCSDLPSVIHEIAQKLSVNGQFILTLPHPMDMIADFKEVSSGIEINVGSYFPSRHLIRGSRYWAKFGGAAPSGYEFDEYVYTISDVINMFLAEGLKIKGFFEPICDHKNTYPCRFSVPAESFIKYYSTMMPQYAIYVVGKE